MARSVNKVTLLGNLGRDPEIFTTQSGTSICKFSVATTQSFKDRNGEWQDKTEWHNVVLWDRLADTAGQYLHKGSRIYLEGTIKYGSYEKDGITRYTTDIQGLSFIMLDPKDQSGEGGGGGGYSSGAPKKAKSNAGMSENLPPDEDDDDDEIPF